MDPTEDLSARFLLKNILSTEPPRSPVTRSKSQRSSGIRRSSRVSVKDAGSRTPQDILRRSLKHKIRESISRKSLPATARRTTSTSLRQAKTPGPASATFDDGDTPRHILRNILWTEPVRSPVVHKGSASKEPPLPADNASITSKRPSIELSGLDLPDLTISNVVSTAKGLSRKRPRRSFNVTAFERRLKDGDGVEEENEESIGVHSSLSLSSTSLSLKTPFVNVHTEKKGLQRRVPNRRKITEEEFGRAVNRRQMKGVYNSAVEQGLCDASYSESFSLGLSELSEPDITTDIVNCNTALYTQPDTTTANISNLATQDKLTLMTSQLQRQDGDATKMEAEQSKSMYGFPTEEEPENKERDSELQLEKDVDAANCQEEEGENTVDDHPESTPYDESEGEENIVKTQTQSEEVDVVSDSKTKEEGAFDLLLSSNGEKNSVVEKDVAASSQSEEEGVIPGSQTEVEEECAAESQTEGEVDEEDAVYPQSGEDAEIGSQSQTEDESDGKQEEDEESEQASEQLEYEHISRRAHGSEGGLMLVTEADTSESGWAEGRSKAHSGAEPHSDLETGSRETSQPHIEVPDLAEPSNQGQEDVSCAEAELDADKENSVHLSGHLGNASPEAAAQDAVEQEEESENEEDEDDDDDDDEEAEEFPCKTPPFVRQKRNFFQADPQTSPTVLKNIQSSSTSKALPATNPKKIVRKRRTAKKEAALPKNYLMGVFKHFAKTKVSADVYPVLKEITDKFFDRMVDDLQTYAVHAKRKNIDVEDVELLLKRQGYVNDKVPVEVLIEKYLRMDQRKLLIPIATSGNIVVPKKRK